VKAKIGYQGHLRPLATPFSYEVRYNEGRSFPGRVGLSLIDAIECGMSGARCRLRRLYDRTQPRTETSGAAYASTCQKGTQKDAVTESRNCPSNRGALRSLYGNYEKHYQSGSGTKKHKHEERRRRFIVVCNNTNVSKLYSTGRWLGETLPTALSWPCRPLGTFQQRRGWNLVEPPNTILIDSHIEWARP